MAMAGVGYKARMAMDPKYRPQSVRNRALGSISTPKGAFNHFPQIADRVPFALGEIVVETTENVASRADALVPVGFDSKGHKAGTLRDSQRVRYSHSRKSGAVVSGRIDYKAKDPTEKDPTHEYAFYVEVGTYKTRAQPFLLPALIGERQPFNAACRDLESRL